MKNTKDFNIPFKSLKAGNHSFEYKIKQEFFDFFKYEDFIDTNIVVKINLLKKDTITELTYVVKGTIKVNCDMSGEEFDLPIENKLEAILKFGPKFNNEDDVIVVLPHEAYEFDVSQHIYEAIILAVPQKRIHPGVVDGTLKSETLRKLEEYKNNEENKTTDPRWDKLKELLTDNKKK